MKTVTWLQGVVAGLVLLSTAITVKSDEAAAKMLLTQFGKDYVYNQQATLDLLDGASQLLADQVREAREKNVTYDFGKTDLFEGMYGMLIGLANCGSGSDEMKALFFRLQNDFGDLRVPAFCSLGEEREIFWKSLVSQENNKEESPRAISPSFNLFRLVVQVEDSISKRTGYRFDGYTGREY